MRIVMKDRGERISGDALRGMVDAFLAQNMHDPRKYRVLPPWPDRERIGEVGLSKQNQVKPLLESFEEI